MKIELAKIGVIQDRKSYNELARRYFAVASRLEIAETMPTAMSLLNALGNGDFQLDILGFDENLTPDEYSGSEGLELYNYFVKLGLAGKLHVVSLSTTPRLPIKAIGNRIEALLNEVSVL